MDPKQQARIERIRQHARLLFDEVQRVSSCVHSTSNPHRADPGLLSDRRHERLSRSLPSGVSWRHGRYLKRLGRESCQTLDRRHRSEVQRHQQRTDGPGFETAVWDKNPGTGAARFQQADRIVLGVPMWNFAYPHKLKLPIDLACTAEHAFTHDGTVYGPLLKTPRLRGLCGGGTQGERLADARFLVRPPKKATSISGWKFIGVKQRSIRWWWKARRGPRKRRGTGA